MEGHIFLLHVYRTKNNVICAKNDQKVESRGFNKHRRPTKQISYFAHRSWLLFPLKLEAGNKVC